MAVGHMAVGHMAVGHMAFGHMAVGHLAERGSCPPLKEERPRIESGEAARLEVEDHLVVEVGDGGAVGALHVVRVDLERRRDVHLPGERPSVRARGDRARGQASVARRLQGEEEASGGDGLRLRLRLGLGFGARG